MNPEEFSLGEETDPLWKCGECGTLRDNREAGEECCRDEDAAEDAPEAAVGVDTPKKVRAHYDRVRPVYETLGRMGPYPTIVLNDFTRWYVTREVDDPDLRDLGYTHAGRPATVDDYDELLERVERTMYAITSYKRPESLDRETAFKLGSDGREWADEENKTPGYGEIVGYPLFGDIDLTKTKDSNGEVRGIREIRFDEGLDRETKETIERTIEAYIDEYAEIYGGREGVQALDSGGGVYVFGPPEATLPIANEFKDDPDALERIFTELRGREAERLKEAQARVEGRVDGAGDVISPDWCNNKNRQYKAPLALHKKDDVLVTPIDTEDVDFSLTRVEDLDDGLISDATAWAESLTSVEHTDAVGCLVSALWPDETARTETWDEALRSWVSDARERELRRTEPRAAPETDVPEGDVTASYEDVVAHIDRLDAEAVAERTIVHRWNDSAGTGGNNRAFFPSWGANSNGTANYINPDHGTWVDTGSGGWGTVVEMALVGAGELDWRTASPADGAEWARGVRELNRLGFDVPVWTPDATTDKARDGKMPYWSLKTAAVALDVLEESDFVEREGEDGDMYLGFPDAGTYNAALRAAEAAGLDHGRNYAGDGSVTPTRKQLDLEEVSEDPEERMRQLHAELELMD